MTQLIQCTLCVAILFALSLPAGAQKVLISEIMYHPASENPKEEFVELFNSSLSAVNLAGWRFSNGVRFSFPNVTIQAGSYLVVAADLATFKNTYPSLSNVVGGWDGTLGNSRQDLDLDDAQGERVDSVQYSDEGDWAVRQKGPDDAGHRGWMWTADHDGGGKSLELRNPGLSNNHGQNWGPSASLGGSPGQHNSLFSTNIPPMILETKHAPLVPKSHETIAISTRILDEQPDTVSVTLRYRVDGQLAFTAVAMRDDGLSSDGKARDGIYGIVLPPQANNIVIEFYLEARDATGDSRSWPAPALIDGQLAQAANLPLQVDDSAYSGPWPLYRLIMTESERRELAALGQSFAESASHAQMNGTFISLDGTGQELRYNVGIRNRGNGSRNAIPNNYRLNFRSDQPWKSVSALNLNSQFPHSQLAASAIFQRAGLPAGDSRPVEVRVNNTNLAVSTWPMFGYYVANEVLNSDFTDHQFPKNHSGHVYRAIRLGLYSQDPGTRATNFNANLSYLGEDPTPYRVNYFKWTNVSEDDWTDLMGLTRSLSPTTPDSLYTRELNRVVNVDQWLRFLALNTLLDNNETSLSNGDGDDYFMYRGREDGRFVLLPYDLDTILGQGNTPGLANNGIFRATAIPVLDRFLKWPEFAPRYYGHLKELIDTTFSSAQLDVLLDQVLSRHVPPPVIDEMKKFAAARRAHVLSLIPLKLSVATDDLPVVDGSHQAPAPVIRLHGSANVIETRAIHVNGASAVWSAWEGKWTAGNVTLHSGINRILVQALDEHGGERARQSIDVLYDSGRTLTASGSLAPGTDGVWRLRDSPIIVTGQFIVPTGAILHIEAGTTVYFRPNSSLLVQGRLTAEGSDLARIRFTRAPGSSSGWRGIHFQNSALENRLLYCDMDHADAAEPSIRLDNSKLLIDHMTWSGTRKTILDLNNSTLTVRNSIFPTIDNNETIHGTGMPADGHVIIENNVFGKTTGYSDVIDFTGGKRPGPIIQVLNNTFMGGGDDGLDLDGTDAHVEGNTFQGFHKDNPSDSSSNAIATDLASEIVAVRNVFSDNDHAVLLKGGASLISQNNTIVGSSIAAINFGEPERGVPPGRAAQLTGDILWGNATNFQNLILANAGVQLTANRSLIAGTPVWPGAGNLNSDPRFVNPPNDLRLRSESPALLAGPDGLDLGAFVSAGAAISGEPRALTPSTVATLAVGGPGITHYRFRVNDGMFSDELPVSRPINLAGLTNSAYIVFVIGKNSAGVWQPETNPTASRTWTVDRSSSALVINEILARNVAALRLADSAPGFVELSNVGETTVDLSGMSLSNDPLVHRKFIFPSGTQLPVGGFLSVLADNGDPLQGLHLGFTLNGAGDSVFLFDKPANGGRLVDSVTFGLQVPDLSIGRLGDGSWGLCRVTFDSENVAIPLGDANALEISEWLSNGGIANADDFLELHNPEFLPVALGGLFLTDNPVGYPDRHRIAPLSFLAAKGHALFTADGRPELGADHLDFKLASEQGALGLFGPSLREIDVVLYGPQQSGVSEGRSADDRNKFLFLQVPTPGRPNLPAATAADRDGDGMPDDWETVTGLSPDSAADANLDLDRDGQTNLAEFLAGTDPRNSQDSLRIENAEMSANGLRIRFTAVAGRAYAVQYSSSLGAATWLKLADVESGPANRTAEVNDPAPVSRNGRFYRLLLRSAP